MQCAVRSVRGSRLFGDVSLCAVRSASYSGRFGDVLWCAVRSVSGSGRFGDVSRCAVRSVSGSGRFGDVLSVTFVPVVVPEISQNRSAFILRLKQYKAEQILGMLDP